VISSGQYALLARFKDVLEFGQRAQSGDHLAIQFTTDPLTIAQQQWTPLFPGAYDRIARDDA